MTTQFIRFDAVTPGQLEKIGGKAASLVKLCQRGFQVPQGFVLPCCTAEEATFDEIETGLRSVLQTLQAPWIVRSSGNAEDSQDHAFAGLFKTVGGLVDRLDVADAVKEVLASVRSKAVLSYARFHGISPDSLRMSVIVQHMLQATISGVAFSRHPTGDQQVVAIEATYGLGMPLVDGTITPDLIEVDMDDMVRYARIGSKREMAVFERSEIKIMPVDENERLRPALSFAQSRTLAKLARVVEQVFGAPQDIEWAIEGHTIYLVQSRPITTFTN